MPHRPLLLFLAALLAGCASVDELAPPPSDLTVAAAHRLDYLADDLLLGREIYLRACGNCHSLQRIHAYAPERWDRVLPDMAGEAHLTADELRQLRAYIQATVRTPPPPH